MIIHVRKKIMISKFLLFEIGGVIRLPSHRRLIFIHNAVSVWTTKKNSFAFKKTSKTNGNVEWGNRKYFKKCQWHGQKEFKKHSVTAGFLLFFAWRLSLFVKHQRLTLLYAEYFWNFFKLFVKRQRFFIKSCRHWSRATWNEKLYKMCIKISPTGEGRGGASLWAGVGLLKISPHFFAIIKISYTFAIS